jgi:hypothetical protein
MEGLYGTIIVSFAWHAFNGAQLKQFNMVEKQQTGQGIATQMSRQVICLYKTVFNLVIH